MNEHSPSLLTPEVQHCPYAFYRQLRTERPITYMPEIGAYYIASYDLARQVLVDTKRFEKKTAEMDGRRYIEPSKAAQQYLLEKDGWLPLNPMSNSAGAVHKSYRGIVDALFSKSRVGDMEPGIRSIVTDLLDGIDRNGECEVSRAFSMPLPIYVMADIFGVSRSLATSIRRWSDGIITYTALIVPDAEAIAGAEAIHEMHRFTLEEVAKRRKEPKDDLFTVLAQGRFEGRPLTDREICSFTDEILVAGNETTTGALNAGFLYLAQRPDIQMQLRAQPELLPRFVEEVLRHTSPLQIALRFSLSDVNLAGVDIPAGSKIFVGIGSANRDESRFPDAEAMDLGRKNAATHVAFGGGEHFCLGAELSRLEQRVAFGEWVSRFSHIELAQDADSIEYPKSYALRAPKAVKLRFHA